MENENMKFYEAGREVPEEAQRKIEKGRLAGFTDINPMWRIKKLTEMFGPAGIGWWTRNEKKEIMCDEITNQKCAFLSLDLIVVDPETGEESHAIHGEGGASMVAQERTGPHLSDECFKMAYTDALSVACKALGIGADVYFEKDKTKYTAEGAKEPTKSEAKEPAKSETKTQGKGKITPKQIEAISARYRGNMMARLLEANGLEKLEDMTIEKASDLIQKIKEADEAKKARAQKEEIA